MTKNDNRNFHAHALTKQRAAKSGAQFKNSLIGLTVATLLGSASYTYFTVTPSERFISVRDYAVASLTWSIATSLHSQIEHVPTMTVTRGGEHYVVPVDRVVSSSDYQANADEVLTAVENGSIGGFAVGVFGLGFAARLRRRKRDAILKDRVVAGTMEISEKQLAKRTKDQADEWALSIGRVCLPNQLETRHMAMIGTTGSGKTTALRQLLEKIAERGEAALVFDPSGEFIEHYYCPTNGDVIINPFDARGAFWSPFSEFRHPADAERIAAQLVPSSTSSHDDVWLKAGRELVANMLRALWREGNGTLEALRDALQIKTSDEIKHWLVGTSSARVFEDNAERATASVLFMLARASNVIQFLRAENTGGKPFAFRDWVAAVDKQVSGRPWIFVPRREEHFEAMKPLMGCWLEAAASAVLALNPASDRRVWFILDELADLPKVDNLIRLLPEGRKFGAAVVLTFQSIGQMRSRYGNQEAEALLGNCNTKLFLQTIDEETRQWASKAIGTCEVDIQTMSDVLPDGKESARTTLSSTRQMRAAVLESDLRLTPHTGYLLLPDGLPVAKIKLTDTHIKARGKPKQPAFVEGDVNTTLWGKTVAAKPEKPASSLNGAAGAAKPAGIGDGPV